VAIAKKLGCSKQRVCQRRDELGKARSPDYCRHNAAGLKKLLELETEKMALEDIALETGYTKISVARILKRCKKKYIVNDRRRIGKYDWSKADWAKTDKEVAFQLGVPNHAVVYQKRRKLGISKNTIRNPFVKEMVGVNAPVNEKVVT
jgi:hypothetical protein